jgi:hypothetical protein
MEPDYSDPRNYLKEGIAKTEILNTESRFIVCSYFWGRNNRSKNSIRGMTYGQQADRLVENCKKLGLNYNVVEFPIFAEKKIYQIALGLKGEFIMNCLNDFPDYNVIFLDADLQILQYPHLFEIDADCFFLNWNEYEYKCYNPYQIELPGGILGFANNHAARTMLGILNEYMINHLHLAEDKSFSGIITRHFMNTYLRCVWLPYNYMYMFQNHKYDPTLGKYTKVVSLEEDLENEDYRLSDIVVIHEDFETGMLDDVFNERVGKKSRWPPNVYRQLGEKLRCEKVTYRNYVDFNLNAEQRRHYRVDFKLRQHAKVYTNVKLQKMDTKVKAHLKHIDLESRMDAALIVSIVDKHTPLEKISKFRKGCKDQDLNYLIYEAKGDANAVCKPSLFYKILKKYKRNICYLDIDYEIKRTPELFKVKNMDFMTFNLNNTNIKGIGECSDMRILRMLNDNLYFFAWNNVTTQFLKIWCEFNKNLKNQHKNLEYAFNISLAINKMRCYWLPKKYLMGPVLHFSNNATFKFFNNRYTDDAFKKLTRALSQCGLKSPLNYGEPLKEHYRGSKHSSTYHNRYGKRFIEF